MWNSTDVGGHWVGNGDGGGGSGWQSARRRKRLVIQETSGFCVNAHPAGEQSRRLELTYCKLVGPSVWTCTCCRAGLRARGDAGGAGRGGRPAVNQVSVCQVGTFTWSIVFIYAFICPLQTLLHAFAVVFCWFPFSYYHPDYRHWPQPRYALLVASSFTPPLHPSHVGGQ